MGRDVESLVLARAVHTHIHHRVFMNGHKTIVFPPSSGSYSSGRIPETTAATIIDGKQVAVP